jgi:hypothetical protein
MATQYSFVTIWRFDAPINAVWDRIIDSERWPQWWKYVQIIEAVAMGELNGTGRWQLSQEGSVTTVRCDWNVSPSKSWMNLLSPVARPIFAWNHGVLMNEGGRSLARLLHARLLDALPQKSVGLPRVLGILGVATSFVLATRMMYVIIKRRKR